MTLKLRPTDRQTDRPADHSTQKIHPTQAAKVLSESAPSKFYRGGFEPQMSKREASLILGTFRRVRVL